MGSWQGPRTAGAMAKKYSIMLTSEQITEVKKGGFFPGRTTMGKLYRLTTLQAVPATQKNPEPTAPEATQTSGQLESLEQNAPPNVDEELDVKGRWTHQAILLLLETFRAKKYLFSSPTTRKTDVWKKISSDLEAKGHIYRADVCEKKFSNFKLRYKKIVDNNKTTGRGTIKWPYYQLMDDLLREDPTINPPIVISSLSGPKVADKRPASTITSVSLSEQTTCTTPVICNDNSQPSTPTEEIELNNSSVHQSSVEKKTTRKRKADEAPGWFKQWAEENIHVMNRMADEMKRKNDLLEKLIEKL